MEYAELGWSVIPVVPSAKTPLTPRGFKDASNEPSQLKLWWREHPEAGVGIVTGDPSGLIVLDVDRRQLEMYLERCAIPWITLHPNERGKQNPVLQRYGIMAIPVVMLINRQGQVVSINARGENLEELIESALAETPQGKGG